MSLIYAIDQGTSSTRVIAFQIENADWKVIFQHQIEFNSIYPEEGWCEQEPMIILQTVKDVSNFGNTYMHYVVKIENMFGETMQIARIFICVICVALQKYSWHFSLIKKFLNYNFNLIDF